MSDSAGLLDSHLAALATALLPFRGAATRLGRWGGELAWRLAHGGRLLVAGNGGSAAEAQHLAAELVGKLRSDRVPLSAIALSAETSSLTAISNDYGFVEVFARQVRAHGRPDDILLLLSSSGRSANLIAAARAGAERGLHCWAFTGPAPNPLAEVCADVLAVPSADPQVVQELHLVAAHVLCEYVDEVLPTVLGPDWAGARPVAAPPATAPATVRPPAAAPAPSTAPAAAPAPSTAPAAAPAPSTAPAAVPPASVPAPSTAPAAAPAPSTAPAAAPAGVPPASAPAPGTAPAAVPPASVPAPSTAPAAVPPASVPAPDTAPAGGPAVPPAGVEVVVDPAEDPGAAR